jgi:hypothetical protein
MLGGKRSRLHSTIVKQKRNIETVVESGKEELAQNGSEITEINEKNPQTKRIKQNPTGHSI